MSKNTNCKLTKGHMADFRAVMSAERQSGASDRLTYVVQAVLLRAASVDPSLVAAVIAAIFMVAPYFWEQVLNLTGAK